MAAINSQDIQNTYGQLGLGSPSQGDINSFMQYANNGSVPLTTFDIGQILQGTPQYQQNLMNQFGGQLNNILGQSDQRMLGIAGNQIQQNFAQQGRNIGSSGYLNAYMNAAANLAMSRQQQLSNFYAPTMQNQMGLAAGQAGQAQQFGQGQQASTLGWNRQQDMYTRMQNDFNNYLRGQGIRNMQSGLMGAGISLGSAGLLGSMGGLASMGSGGSFGKGFLSMF